MYRYIIYIIYRSSIGYNKPNKSYIIYLFVYIKLIDDNTILYMGGGLMPTGNCNDTFWQFDTTCNEWKELCPLHKPRSELGMKIILYYSKASINQFEKKILFINI